MKAYDLKVITAQEAAEILRQCGMRISPTLVRDGLRQGLFPFGTLIQSGKSIRCFVYERQLNAWIRERAGE